MEHNLHYGNQIVRKELNLEHELGRQAQQKFVAMFGIVFNAGINK